MNILDDPFELNDKSISDQLLDDRISLKKTSRTLKFTFFCGENISMKYFVLNVTLDPYHLIAYKFYSTPLLSIEISVTRLGALLDFGQFFKAFGNN